MQVTETPDLTTFQTDFNVTFGVCICFDLFFDLPANGLVERGVRNFVFPTMWFSEIPYLSGEIWPLEQVQIFLKLISNKHSCKSYQLLNHPSAFSCSIPTELGLCQQCEFTGCEYQLAKFALFRKWHLCGTFGCAENIRQSNSNY